MLFFPTCGPPSQYSTTARPIRLPCHISRWVVNTLSMQPKTRWIQNIASHAFTFQVNNVVMIPCVLHDTKVISFRCLLWARSIYPLTVLVQGSYWPPTDYMDWTNPSGITKGWFCLFYLKIFGSNRVLKFILFVSILP